MQEEWKEYKTYGRWGNVRTDIEVSNFGNVRGFIDGKPARLGMVNGRHIICGRRLYYFVWELFNGPIPKGYQIHHKDENRLNDRLDNLEILTEFEHKSLHGKEKVFTEEYRKKLSEGNTGKVRSAETRKKLSMSLLGNKNAVKNVDS